MFSLDNKFQFSDIEFRQLDINSKFPTERQQCFSDGSTLVISPLNTSLSFDGNRFVRSLLVKFLQVDISGSQEGAMKNSFSKMTW